MKLPVYDVSDYLPDKVDAASGKLSINVAYDLWSKLGAESSVLLPPEIAVRDFCEFDSAMLHGFAVLIGYGDGPEIFARGLNAARAIDALEHTKIMEEVKSVMEHHGFIFPDPLPEEWDPSDEVSCEMQQAIAADLVNLSARYDQVYKIAGDVYMKLLQYVYNHRDALACRRP
jgi:hypothetical protein